MAAKPFRYQEDYCNHPKNSLNLLADAVSIGGKTTLIEERGVEKIGRIYTFALLCVFLAESLQCPKK